MPQGGSLGVLEPDDDNLTGASEPSQPSGVSHVREADPPEERQAAYEKGSALLETLQTELWRIYGNTSEEVLASNEEEGALIREFFEGLIKRGVVASREELQHYAAFHGLSGSSLHLATVPYADLPGEHALLPHYEKVLQGLNQRADGSGAVAEAGGEGAGGEGA